ncbi:MAG: CAP domain-containing protein [Acidimicrobiales bacterium]
MSVLTPPGHRAGQSGPPGPPPPQPQERVTRSPGSVATDWLSLDRLTGRGLLIGAAALIVFGLIAAIALTTGNDGDQATLTAPGADTATEGLDADADADDPAAANPATSSDINAFAADAPANDDGAETAPAERDAADSGDTESSVAPPTIAPATAPTEAPTTAPTTAPPTTAAPTTEPPTTAAPTTPPPSTTPPTTAAPTTAAPAPTQAPAPGGGSAEQQVLNRVNAERAGAGCGPVSYNGQLNSAALSHSQDMSANGYFSHTGLNGSQPWDRAVAAGYSYSSMGENIAQGYGSADAVMNGWMNSSGHRANILNCSFTEMGLGRAGNANYWTQLFGRPG